MAFAPVPLDTIISIMAETLPTSLDPADRDAVRKRGSLGAASYLVELAHGAFEWAADWWQAVRLDETAVVGCVMPVVYAEGPRDGGDEGTILHMGVVPAYRGRGIGELLLARATDLLLDHGVWRIYCDTAATNTPMIAAFTRQGWTRQAPHEAPYWG